jgi:FkbM family methyltransferase
MKSDHAFLKPTSKKITILYLKTIETLLNLSKKTKFLSFLKTRQYCVKLTLQSNITRIFFHRLGVADIGVMKQIFIAEDYKLSRLRRFNQITQTYNNMVADGKTPFIIDAGSNIGASAVYFALNFPKARIICFEPDLENFKLIQKNTHGLNVDLRQQAIGSDNGRVELLDVGANEWGYRTLASEDGLHILSAMNDVVNEQISQNLTPFIVKIDIEGGEANLFEKNIDWIDLFPLLIIELHDWMLPEKGSSISFLDCIGKFKRDFVHIGENIFSIKN